MRVLNGRGYDDILIALYEHNENEVQTVIWMRQSFYHTETYCNEESARRED